nr:ribonuclease H-like domain-containing protein [Tanacetum cinerariifolium]
MLKTRDYDLWIMRMEQYLTHIDYALWEVIINGDSHVPEPPAVGAVVLPKTEAQKVARKNKLKAKSTLLLAIPEEHLLKFHSIKDAKSLWEAIKIRFQKIISQLELNGEVISQEDANMKLLRSLPLAWNNIAHIIRNKPDIETLSMDDLYINLKVYEVEIKGQSSSSSNSHNVAFVSSENNSSINETVNAVPDIPAAGSKEQPSASSYADDVMFSFFASQSNTPQLDNEDLEQIDTDDLEEMDLKWQVDMITIRVKKFMTKTRRNLNFNGKEPVGFCKTRVECYNCHRRGHLARECHALRNQGNKSSDNERRVIPAETPASALVIQDGLDVLKEKLTKFEESSKNLTKLINSQMSANDKTGIGYDSQLSENEMPKCEIFKAASDSSVNEIDEDNNQAKDSVNHLIKDYTFYENKMVEKSVVNNKGKAVATKSGQVLVNATKQSSATSTSTARSKGNPQYTLQDQRIFESECSSHMTGNKSFLIEYQEIDGGFVAFGGSLKGDFKLLDESQVLLKVPRQNNMYSFDLKNASKDETSGILKTFVTCIENQLNHKVKFIRCDNGTEFKNSEMNQFCQLKRIKRVFSVARTPQQNEVAKMKNKTLIEAAMTILTDSLLPTKFWAEAVNTACYVQNRVSVTKPQNKTPYELLIGRSPNLEFMRPFGCLVTILNTLDHLGKFDEKADEGFLVGCSVNSKAFRVFNSRTRKVEENMHFNFLENKPNVVGSGPEWLFDIVH